MALPVYATKAELKAFSPHLAILGDPELDALLEPASRDLDNIAVTRRRLDDGSRFEVAELEERQATALSRAVCAQAEYRHEMGPKFFIRPQYPKVSGPDHSTEGTLPEIGPKVWREVAGTGLIPNTTTTGPDYAQAPWADFRWNLEND